MLAMMSFRPKVFDGVVLFLLNFFLNFIAFFLLLHFFCEKAEYMRASLSHSRDERR